MKCFLGLLFVLVILVVFIAVGTSYKNEPSLSFQFTASTVPTELFSVPQTKADIDVGIVGRSVKIPEIEVVKSVTLLHQSQTQNQSESTLAISWVGQGLIICLIKNVKEASSTLYISRDSGGKFESATHLLIASLSPAILTALEGNKTSPTVTRIFSDPKSGNGKLILVDAINQLIFTTDDLAISFKGSKVPFTPHEITFDPHEGNILLGFEINTENKASSDDTIVKQLWISRDFGISWNILQKSVKSFSWDATTMQLYIHKKDSNQIITSKSFFQTSQDTSMVLESVDEFAIKDDFMFATKKNKEINSLELWISYKRGKFVRSSFPIPISTKNVPITNFHIAHVSTLNGRIFVCVTHGHNISNLYVATMPKQSLKSPPFTLSLDRIVFFNSNQTSREGDTEAFADFHPIDGLSGVFVANTLNPFKSVISMVTFDHGIHWKAVNCSDSVHSCALQVTHRLNPVKSATQTPPIITKISENGHVIIATGRMTPVSNTNSPLSIYISTDGAHTWRKSLEGSYLLNVDNYSDIIVAIKLYQSKIGDATDTLLYSTDKGVTWNNYKFYTERIGVVGLMTEASKSSNVTSNDTTNFFIIGSTIKSGTKKASSSWVFIKVNLKIRSNLFDLDPVHPLMLITMPQGLENISVFRVNNLTHPQILPMNITGSVKSLDFDVKRNVVYWADNYRKTVNRISLDPSASETPEILTRINSTHQDVRINGLAFDWLSRNLYICDGEGATISVIRTDAPFKIKWKHILGPKHLKKPRGLALHPVQGYLYWTDLSFEPYIGRSWLNGSHLLKIVQNPSSNTKIIKYPTGLTVDCQDNKLYWADYVLEYIARSDLDGQNIKIIIEKDKQMNSIFAVGLSKERLYWYNWDTKSIYSLKKPTEMENSQKYEMLLELANETGVWNLKVFDVGMQSGTNSCSLYSTKCSYFCFSSPINTNQSVMHTCESSADSMTHSPSNQNSNSCGVHEFQCVGNKHCISKDWRCDGDRDCIDGSDENECVISVVG